MNDTSKIILVWISGWFILKGISSGMNFRSTVRKSSWQLHCWTLRCSWSIACRCCSNYIFILDLTPGVNGLGKDNGKTRREAFNRRTWAWSMNLGSTVYKLVGSRPLRSFSLIHRLSWSCFYPNKYTNVLEMICLEYIRPSNGRDAYMPHSTHVVKWVESAGEHLDCHF